MNHPRKLFLNYRNNLLMLYKNLSPREWKSKSRKRRVLDFMAWVMFLVKGEWANARSVGRAYREFGKMKKGYISATIIPKQDPCIYPGSVIFAFYFSITTVLSVSAGRSTRMICPLTRRKQPESSFVRFSRITT